MADSCADSCDVLIVGASPAGLCLASALADAGFISTLLDRQPQQADAGPAHPPQSSSLAAS